MNGVCIGERTIAAHVVKDNYRTIRDLSPSLLLFLNSPTPSDLISDTGSTHKPPTTNNNYDTTAQPASNTTSFTTSSTALTRTDCQQYAKSRILWLEVIWSKTQVSTQVENLSAFDLKPGTVIQRIQMDLEQYEIYRVPYVHESKRWSLYNEWTALSECYINLEVSDKGQNSDKA